MGLIDLLVNQGSPYSYGDGATPPTNLGATKQSVLHADGILPGYSLDGSDFSTVNGAYQQYNDGITNGLLRLKKNADEYYNLTYQNK